MSNQNADKRPDEGCFPVAVDFLELDTINGCRRKRVFQRLGLANPLSQAAP
jgi:hypothetical protein